MWQPTRSIGACWLSCRGGGSHSVDGKSTARDGAVTWTLVLRHPPEGAVPLLRWLRPGPLCAEARAHGWAS